MTGLLVIASLIWAGSASAQIKGGGYEIDPEPKRPDLQPRSHFYGGFFGGALGFFPGGPHPPPPLWGWGKPQPPRPGPPPPGAPPRGGGGFLLGGRGLGRGAPPPS